MTPTEILRMCRRASSFEADRRSKAALATLSTSEVLEMLLLRQEAVEEALREAGVVVGASGSIGRLGTRNAQG